jgi:hypothetical protein
VSAPKEREGRLTGRDAPQRDVVPGDHVFYHHPQLGSQTGQVYAVGKDGFRARTADGGNHEVGWSGFLGHKLRRQRKFTLVDRGEDGALCTDEDGKPVFLRNGGAEAERLSKAMPGDSFMAIPPPPPALDFHLLGLELGRAQLETAALTVAALDRLTSAVRDQTGRIDQLIALQVAALNSPLEPHDYPDHPLHQEHQAAL